MARRTISVPLDLKPLFLQDPENFIRDIACISTESTRPFFKRNDKIIEVYEKGFKNPFNDETLEFDEDFKPTAHDMHRRFMHIDLGLTKDAVGISMCHSPGFKDREEISFDDKKMVSHMVRVPAIKFDFLGRIKSVRGEEILLSRVRELIYEISSRGFYLALITFDGFQSIDSIQILRSQGYKIARLSIDRTATKIILDKKAPDGSGLSRHSTEGQILGPMQALKDVLYDNRLSLPKHKYWEIEAKGAEIDYKKNKVDHKPRGSIDLLQSMAGGVYNLINNEFEYMDDEETETQGDDFYESVEFDDDVYYEPQENEQMERPDLW